MSNPKQKFDENAVDWWNKLSFKQLQQMLQQFGDCIHVYTDEDVEEFLAQDTANREQCIYLYCAATNSTRPGGGF